MKKNTAVIIVDMQDFFLKNFPASISKSLIENQTHILNLCIKKKIPIVLLEYKAGGILRGKTTAKLLKLVNGSIVKTFVKENNCGFTDTTLHDTLKDLRIGTVLIIGLNANGCVQDTAISALHRGYKVITGDGVIASSSRGDLTLSSRNKKWFKKNTIFFEHMDGLKNYLK
jgi:nicotinamidase-related amidase